jgi:alkylhydroperoxidase family enzyme
MERQFDMLYAYLALGRRPGNAGDADERTRLLVRELSAERSGCRWCVERVRHDWRVAGLPVDLLRQLARHESSPAFTERERAALALVDAVACRPGAPETGTDRRLTELRRHFSERATAELIACMAEHHLFADEHR